MSYLKKEKEIKLQLEKHLGYNARLKNADPEVLEELKKQGRLVQDFNYKE